MRVLILDDIEAAGRLRCSLVTLQPAWLIDIETNPIAGLAALLDKKYDVALIALNLGEGALDGFEICRRVRASERLLGLVVLAVSEEREARLRAFQCGADHYVVREGTSEELRASTVAAARRGLERQRRSGVVSIERLNIDVTTQTVRVEGKELVLTRRQCVLLWHLANHLDQGLSAQKLCEVAGVQTSDKDKNLRNELSRLRQRVRSTGLHIRNIRNSGYRLVVGRPEVPPK